MQYFLLLPFLCVVIHVTSVPVRRNEPWSMVLCRLKKNLFTPKSYEYMRRWLVDEETDGSVANYFKRVSNGLYSISGSNVLGWYKNFSMKYGRKDVTHMGNIDPALQHLIDPHKRTFLKAKELCISTALSAGAVLHTNVITIINDGSFAVFCSENGVLLSPEYLMTSALVHEIAHSLNLGHSFSDSEVKIYPHGDKGEYDDVFDLMSTAHARMYDTSFGKSGPGLNGPHLDYLGWLPADRATTIIDGFKKLTLSSLSLPHSDTTGTLLLRIPFDRDNAMNFYTVEYRTPVELDRGITTAQLVIHKVSDKQGYLYSHLIKKSLTQYGWLAGDELFTYLDGDGTQYIRVKVLQLTEKKAYVAVTTKFSPTACLEHETHRGAFGEDKVCVFPAERDQILIENYYGSKRVNKTTGECLDGFEYRLADANDLVCVTPSQHERVENQNNRYHNLSRRFHRENFGLNACSGEHIWRLTDRYDYVCVHPRRRAEIQLRSEIQRRTSSSAVFNEIASCKTDCRTKTLPTAGNASASFKTDCKSPYVRRQATANDAACVLPKEASKTKTENRNNIYNLYYRRFFNGVDLVRF